MLREDAEGLSVVIGSSKRLRALSAALNGVAGVIHYDRKLGTEDLAMLHDPDRWARGDVRVALVDLKNAGEMAPLNPETKVKRVILLAKRSPGHSWQSLADILSIPAEECHAFIEPGRWDGRSSHPFPIRREAEERRADTLQGVARGGTSPPPEAARAEQYRALLRSETAEARQDGRVPAACVYSYHSASGATLSQVTVTRNDEDQERAAKNAKKRWKLLSQSARARRACRVGVAPLRDPLEYAERVPPRTRAEVDSQEVTRLVDLYGTDPQYTSRNTAPDDETEDEIPLQGLVGLACDDETGKLSRKMTTRARYAHIVAGDLIGAARDDRRAVGTGYYDLGDGTTLMEEARYMVLSHPLALGPEWAALLGQPPGVTLLPDGTLVPRSVTLPPIPEWHSYHPLDDPRPGLLEEAKKRWGSDASLRRLGIRPEHDWARWVGDALKGPGYRSEVLGQPRMTEYDEAQQPLPGKGKPVRVRTIDLAHFEESQRLGVIIIARSFGAFVDPLAGPEGEAAWAKAVDPETGGWRRVSPEEQAWPGEFDPAGGEEAPPAEEPEAVPAAA